MNGHEERMRIWGHSATIAQHAARQVGDMDGHILLICDTADSMGGPVAQALSEKANGPDYMRQHAEKVAEKNEAQTMIAVVPIDMMIALFEATSKQVAKALETTVPNGKMFVAIIAAEGTTLMLTSIPRTNADNGKKN